MTKRRQAATEMVRLPGDVVRALRRRAARADITIGEAARQLVLKSSADRPLGLLEHIAWLRDRLSRRLGDLEALFEQEGADPRVVRETVEALARLLQEWDEKDDDEYSFLLYSPR